jgi:hypothetical protein
MHHRDLSDRNVFKSTDRNVFEGTLGSPRYYSVVNAALLVYLAGVVAGLWRTDARAAARVGLAVLWPVGPLAFVATVAVLLAASLIAFPLVGAVVALAATVTWWWLG